MTPLVEARALVVERGGRRILDGVDVRLERGRVLALLGPSGAGKSTLLRGLHMLEPPTRGSVEFEGQVVAPRARRAAYRRFGLVQQKPGLLDRTALENVAFPLRVAGATRGEAHARSMEALATIDAASLASRQAASLSGGESQRVALARATVGRPEVLLLDEAFNQLDPDNAERAESLVRAERARGAAILLVTHAIGPARRLADDVALLVNGRVVEEGRASEVFAAPRTPILQKYLDRA